MFGRLVLSVFALWWGYNAIQMFECEYVRWSSWTASCTTSSGYPSGAVTGGAILVAAVLLLGYLWVWPFIRTSRVQSRQLQSLMQMAGESVSHADAEYSEVKRAYPRLVQAKNDYRDGPDTSEQLRVAVEELCLIGAELPTGPGRAGIMFRFEFMEAYRDRRDRGLGSDQREADFLASEGFRDSAAVYLLKASFSDIAELNYEVFDLDDEMDGDQL